MISPDFAAGNVTLTIVRHLCTPNANEASRTEFGTSFNDSSVVLATIGYLHLDFKPCIWGFDTFTENEWRGKRSLEMLSRKHFIELAKVLAQSKASENVINGVIAFCKSENPRFLEYRFRNYIRKIRRDSL